VSATSATYICSWLPVTPIGARPLGDEAAWRDLVDFRRHRLRGIDEDDAGKIVTAWESLGSAGLGQLSGMTHENAVRRLLETARDEVVKRRDGSLLGAMIELRYGEAFKEYVQKLLDRLRERDAPGGTLLNAYAYVAAMHAENLLFLSKPVLASVLGCDERILQRDVLRPLADEAAAAAHGGYVLTRHRAIAETAIAVLTEADPDFEPVSTFTKLAVAAERSFLSHRNLPDIADWCFTLPRHFSRKGQHNSAIQIAAAIRDVEPGNAYLIVSLAKTLRNAGRPSQALQVFEQAAEEIETKDRGFYYEWGTTAGSSGDQAASLWLDGISLADLDRVAITENDQAKLSLAGLGVAAGELFKTTQQQVFMEARAAAGQLGLRLKLDSRARGYLQRYKDEAAAVGVREMSVDQALVAIERAVEAAYRRCGKRDLLVELGVLMPEEMSFSGLRRLFGVAPPGARSRR